MHVAYSAPVLLTVTLLFALHAEPVLEPRESDGVTLDSQRVKRFIGALVGGAVALAIPLAISAPNCSSGTCSTNAFQNFSLGIMPLVGGLGAYFGHHLFGGEAEYPFAAIGAGMGSLIGMLVLSFAQAINVQPNALFPFVAGAAGLTTFLMAILLDTRDHAIGALVAEGHASGARLWATFGASVGVGIAGTFVSLLLGFVNPFAGLITGTLFLAAVPLVAFGVHSALEGKGTLGSAFLGLLVSLALVGVVALPVLLTTGSGPSAFYGAQQAALATGPAFLALLAGPLIGLELSHTGIMEQSSFKPSFSMAPVPGGAMAGASLRF